MFDDPEVSEALRNQWYVVAEASDVAAAPVPITLLGRRHVLWRRADGRIVASADRCPHREAPLSAGHLDDGCLVCPYHGWTFDGDGICIAIPSATPGTPIPPTARLATHHVRERYGLVWLSTGTPAGEPPVIAQDTDPTYRRLNAGTETWHTPVTRMTDNFCAVAHFPFVHAGTIGRKRDVQPGRSRRRGSLRDPEA